MVKDLKVPEGWRRVRLGEVVDIILSNVDKKFYTKEKPILLCNYLEVYRNDYITKSINFMRASATNREIKKFKISKGDVIITKDSEEFDDIAKPSYVYDEIKDLICGYHLTLLKPKNNVDGLFLAKVLILKPINVFFQNRANGITRFGITKETIHNAIIPFPPFPEQHKIAEILETVDNAIEKTDAIIEKYKRIKQGLMQDLLTKGINENWQIRTEKIHRLKDSTLGRIPEEWEVVRLGQISESIDYGYTESASNEEIGPKFLRITDIQDSKVIWENVPYCRISNRQLSKYIVKSGDIVFARTGATTGKSYYIKNPPFAVFASYLIRVRLIDNLNPKFVWYFLNSTKYWFQINLDIAGSTQEGFNASKLKKLLVLIPPLPEQQRIATVLSQIDEVIEKERAYKEKLEKIKKGLMDDLLTGKVRVNCLIEEADENVQQT